MSAESSSDTTIADIELQKKLVKAWKNNWDKSQRQFAKEYKLNQGNFSRYLALKTTRISITQAIISYLSSINIDWDETNQPDIQQTLIDLWRQNWLDKPINFCEKYNLNPDLFDCYLLNLNRDFGVTRAIVSFLITRNVDLANYHIPTNWVTVREKELLTVVPLAQFEAPLNPNLKALILVDGDQACQQVARLAWLNLPPDIPLQIIIVFSAVDNHVHERIRGLLKSLTYTPTWITVVHASSSKKNAADVALITIAERCRNLPLEIPFLLVTNDLFADPLISDIHSYGRTNSLIIDRIMSDLGLYLLKIIPEIANSTEANTNIASTNIAKEVRYFLQLDSSDAFNIGQHVSQLCSPVAPHITPTVVINTITTVSKVTMLSVNLALFNNFPDLKLLREQTQKMDLNKTVVLGVVVQDVPLSSTTAEYFSAKGWFDIFSLHYIQRYLGIKFYICGLQHYVKRSDSEYEPDSNLEDDEKLRSAYRMLWHASQRTFAKMYNINQGYFSSWLQRRRPITPSIAMAIELLIEKNNKN